MAQLHFENFSNARGVHVGHQTINLISGNQYLLNGRKNIVVRLNPILDSSHTRDLRASPPDSACFPGTRKTVIRIITSWANIMIAPRATTAVHVYWFHGFAGSGKSAISLEIAKLFASSGRLLASYFFFRNSGDRSRMHRFAVTLAAQMAAAVPATAPFIEAALDAEPGLLNQGTSLNTQLERLVYEPFRAALKRGLLVKALIKGPFLIVVDGLDECEDKVEAATFIDHMLDYFKRYPSIPLRFFIASRVEEHIRARLENDGVLVGDLNEHSAYRDIETFLRASFEGAAVENRVIQEYVRTHGQWPTKEDMHSLIRHIKGSFVLASTMFKLIVQPATEEDPSTTPMERLPLALKENGLDGLYMQTLARSQNLPHFQSIVFTLALLEEPLPVVGIADLLDIEAFEVVRVLLNLQAILHVPGTDEQGNVTLCHTSLRDFLTTKSRSGRFFVPPSFHLRLSYCCFPSIVERSNRHANFYRKKHLYVHWRKLVKPGACDLIKEIRLFKTQARQSPVMQAFLCTLLFYSLSLLGSQITVGLSYLLIECTESLALAVESPDTRIELWLGTVFPSGLIASQRVRTDLITDLTFAILKANMQRASSAIRVNFPGILLRHPHATGMEREYNIGQDLVFFHLLSGREIFGVLEWIVARAQFIWEECQAPRLPLKLLIALREFQLQFRLVRHVDQT